MDQLTQAANGPRSAGRRAGLTLVEVMLASVLLSVGLLAMLALQMHAMRGSQMGRHYTQAAQIARDWMEQLHRQRWADVGPTAGWQVNPVVTNAVQLDGGGTTAEQAYTLDYRITADPVSPTELRQFDVRVTWYEANDPPPPAVPRRRYAITSMRFNDGT
jgi:Tfp pilus assembly protein PilE